MNNHAPVIVAALCLLDVTAMAAEPAAPSTLSKAPAATAATSPAVSSAPATSAAVVSDDATLAKQAASVGYKARQQGGKTVYCRKAPEVGTRLETTTCISKEQVSAVLARSQGNKDSIDGMQRAFRNEPPPIEPNGPGR